MLCVEKKSETNPTKGWRLYPEFFDVFEMQALKASRRNRRVRQLDCAHAALLSWSMMSESEQDFWLSKALTLDISPLSRDEFAAPATAVDADDDADAADRASKRGRNRKRPRDQKAG